VVETALMTMKGFKALAPKILPSLKYGVKSLYITFRKKQFKDFYVIFD
jgi:hypothetical protein